MKPTRTVEEEIGLLKTASVMNTATIVFVAFCFMVTSFFIGYRLNRLDIRLESAERALHLECATSDSLTLNSVTKVAIFQK